VLILSCNNISQRCIANVVVRSTRLVEFEINKSFEFRTRISLPRDHARASAVAWPTGSIIISQCRRCSMHETEMKMKREREKGARIEMS